MPARRNRLPASGCGRTRHTHAASAVAPLPTQSSALAGALVGAIMALCNVQPVDQYVIFQKISLLLHLDGSAIPLSLSLPLPFSPFYIM